MSSKSFKDHLDEAKAKESEPVKETVTVEEVRVEEPVAQRPSPTMTVIDNELITEQREASQQMIQLVLESNAQIVATTKEIVESNGITSLALVEAIAALTDKIELLETKLEAIENLEIPTPIVNLAMPNKKVNKEVHRDKKGVITHITESEVFDDEGE